VAEAMGVKFLAKGNNSSTEKAPTGHRAWNLVIARQMPWQSATASNIQIVAACVYRLQARFYLSLSDSLSASELRSVGIEKL